MSNLDRLNEVAAGLPESVLGELVDFAEFLKAKAETSVTLQANTDHQAMLEVLRAEIRVGVADLRQGQSRPASDVFAELTADLPDETSSRE